MARAVGDGSVIYSGGIGSREDLEALADLRRELRWTPRRRDRRQGAVRGALHGRRGASRRSRRVTPVSRMDAVTPSTLTRALQARDPLPGRRRAGASSRASNSSTSATPATPSSWPPTTTARAPTSSCSSTSPPRTRSATRSPSSRAAPPTRCSCRSRSAAASARSPTPRRCSTRAPTRSRSTPPRSQRPELLDELADVFGAQCVVLAIDAKARTRP